IQEAEGPVEPRAMLLILFRLASALHDVHSAGIVHRDIKPSNIVMSTNGLRPTIIDFGVATTTDSNASMPLATTKYLAPEIYAGNGEVDGRADLYSLGFIAYEMLIGREKFNEIFEDIVRDKHSQALRWMKWHGNPAVTAPRLHDVLPSIPVPLSNVVARLMEKDPNRRFKSAEEFAIALRGNFAGKTAKKSAPAKVGQHKGKGGMISQMANMEIDSMQQQGMDVPQFSKSAAAAASHDGGVILDETPTAPLPAGPMSRRKKIMLISLASAAAVFLVALLSVFLMNAHYKSEHYNEMSRQVYIEGANLFTQGRFGSAMEKFDEVCKEFPHSSSSDRARLLGIMCKINIDIDGADWAAAQLQENTAEEFLNKLQTTSNNEEFTNWLRKRKTDLDALKRYRYSSNIFYNATNAARKMIKNPIKVADFDQALNNLSSDLAIGDVNLTEGQEKALAELKNCISRERVRFTFSQLLRDGDTAEKLGQYDVARQAYQKALALFDGSEPGVKLLDRGQYENMLATASQKLKELMSSQTLAKLIEAINRAHTNNDDKALKSAITQALKMPDLDAKTKAQYTKELRLINAREKLSKAKRLIAEGKTSAARETLVEADKLCPKNAEISDLISKLDAAAKRETIINDASAEFTAGRYSKAMNLYVAAQKISEDSDTASRIIDCRFNLAVENAKQLAQEKKYDEARAEYTNAKQIKPAAAAQVDAMLVMLDDQQKYQNLVEMGDKEMKQNRFQEALKYYDDASKIQATPEIQKRVQLTRYKKDIYLGKRALEEDDEKTARYHFKRALQFLDTPEARELLNKVGGANED
ncbi:MAG TPA: serine/threonine-protein kinase, partial [Phycisphaerae bacterium]|nr:serine/threonine-protein kinase [Phycisphaerae bacterium]